MIARLVLAALLAALVLPSSASAFSGKVLLSCGAPTGTSPDDPIVRWGMPGAAHQHEFAGSTLSGPSVTLPQLLTTETNCGIQSDHALYWFPAIKKPDGTFARPYSFRVYYIGDEESKPVVPFPQGFRYIGGNPNNTTASKGAGVFNCQPGATDTTGHAVIPANCQGKGITATIRMPPCWDGLNYGPGGGGQGGDNGFEHMAQESSSKCPASHPIQMIKLQYVINYGADAPGGRLSSDQPFAPAGSSFHADLFNAWDPSALQKVVDRCLNIVLTNPNGVTCRQKDDAILLESDHSVVITR